MSSLLSAAGDGSDNPFPGRTLRTEQQTDMPAVILYAEDISLQRRITASQREKSLLLFCRASTAPSSQLANRAHDI